MPSATTWRIGLQSVSAGATIYVGRIEVHRGHAVEPTSDPRVSYASAPPTTGIYAVGDRVINSSPASDAPREWVCIAAPSTFYAEALAVVSTSVDYTVPDNVRVVKATGGSSGINVTLPTATAGRPVEVKKVDGGAGKVTLIGTVDGVTNPTLDFQGDSLELVADGTSWESFG